MTRTVKIISVVATAALLGWAACNKQNRLHAKAGSAPDFALKDTDGRTVHLSDYRGKVVVLDFWATWCSPCRKEIPYFTEFERDKKSRGFAVLGVSMDDDGWTAVRPFIKDFSVNYRVVLGDDKTADLYGGIEAMPTTFLIDRDGRIVAKHIGYTEKREFEDAIEKLLSGSGSDASVAPPASSPVAQTHGL